MYPRGRPKCLAYQCVYFILSLIVIIFCLIFYMVLWRRMHVRQLSIGTQYKRYSQTLLSPDLFLMVSEEWFVCYGSCCAVFFCHLVWYMLAELASLLSMICVSHDYLGLKCLALVLATLACPLNRILSPFNDRVFHLIKKRKELNSSFERNIKKPMEMFIS